MRFKKAEKRASSGLMLQAQSILNDGKRQAGLVSEFTTIYQSHGC